MNKGFIQIRRGLREHLQSMSSNAVKLYLWLHLSVNWTGPKRGCVEASYEDIARALGWSQKTLQRTVAELTPKYIEVAHANQFKPTTLRIIKYNSAVDESVQSEPAVDTAVDTAVDKSVLSDVHSNPVKPQTANDLRASKNVIEGIEEKKKSPPAKPAPPDSRHKAFFDCAYQLFKMRYGGQPPTWGGREAKHLQAFLKSNPYISQEEMEQRYRSFLKSTNDFYRQKGGSLTFFLSNFDHFIDGPILEKGKANGKLDANQAVAITMQAAASNARRLD